MRDNTPDVECHLNLTGTDVVEDYWSKHGQWIGNRRNYTFGDMKRNTGNMIRLEAIKFNADAPEFAKPHPKQESIWHKQHDQAAPKADLTD